MTWAEFKAAVEAAGVTDVTPIDWIDVGSGLAQHLQIELTSPTPYGDDRVAHVQVSS